MFYSRKELAKLLKVSKDTLRRLPIPYVRVGRRGIRYRWSDVEMFLASRKDGSDLALGARKREAIRESRLLGGAR